MTSRNFTGTEWSLFPPHRVEHPALVGSVIRPYAPAIKVPEMNFVTAERAVSSRILAVLLTRQGELPLLPWFGISPTLFQSLSDINAQFFVHHAQTAILAANRALRLGIGQVVLSVNDQGRYTETFDVDVTFSVAGIGGSNELNTLSFDFASYRDSLQGLDIIEFKRSVSLNEQTFYGV